MLQELLENGYGKDLDLNCAETVLYGANVAYDLGLDPQALKMAAAFGGGMAIESVCGALTGAIMALGRLFVEDRAHESTRIKELTVELFNDFEQIMGSIYCGPLKESYRTEELKCHLVIVAAARALDQIVARENGRQ